MKDSCTSSSNESELSTIAPLRRRGFLDAFIRTEGTPPPYTQPIFFKKISLLLLIVTSVIVSYHVCIFHRLPFPLAFGSYWLIFQGTTLFDAMVSNNFSHNVHNLRRAGFSDAIILLYFQTNLILSQLIGYTIMTVVIQNQDVFRLDYFMQQITTPKTLFSVLCAVIINLSLTEILFMIGHGIMHKVPSFMLFHVFHHACTAPSLTTNSLFHPIDLGIEFAGPALGLLAMHYFVWKEHNDMILLVTYLIFQLWYAYDHDEHLQLYHVQHHTRCDSLYAIYIKMRGNPEGNLLRNWMNEHGLVKARKLH